MRPSGRLASGQRPLHHGQVAPAGGLGAPVHGPLGAGDAEQRLRHLDEAIAGGAVQAGDEHGRGERLVARVHGWLREDETVHLGNLDKEGWVQHTAALVQDGPRAQLLPVHGQHQATEDVVLQREQGAPRLRRWRRWRRWRGCHGGGVHGPEGEGRGWRRRQWPPRAADWPRRPARGRRARGGVGGRAAARVHLQRGGGAGRGVVAFRGTNIRGMAE